MKLITAYIGNILFVLFCLFIFIFTIINIQVRLEINHSNTKNWLRPLTVMASGNPLGVIGLCSVIRYLILESTVLLGMASGSTSGAIGLCSVIRYLILESTVLLGMASGNPSGAIGLCSVIRYLILQKLSPF